MPANPNDAFTVSQNFIALAGRRGFGMEKNGRGEHKKI